MQRLIIIEGGKIQAADGIWSEPSTPVDTGPLGNSSTDVDGEWQVENEMKAFSELEFLASKFSIENEVE